MNPGKAAKRVMTFDAIVIGLGAAGSAAACHLARKGQRVLGLDRYRPPHGYGSSHGRSRIIRKAYFEGALYVPLLERAYELWRALEREAGARLMHLEGGLMVGAEDSVLIRGAQRSAQVHGIPHEMFGAGELRGRFPAFRPAPHEVGLFEPEAGWLDPEACIRAHLDQAARHGAVLRFDEAVTGWHVDGEAVRVDTPQGRYEAGTLALCAGGWTRDLAGDLGLPVRIERQVSAWFRPVGDAGAFAPGRCPIYIWEYEPGRVLYGFPDAGHGVKAGLHHGGALVDHPDELQRAVRPEDIEALRIPLRRLLPGADGPLVEAVTCFYTNTPDERYLIDRHPAAPNVVLASACSGHGFKVASAVGEAVAELVVNGRTSLDLAVFGISGGLAS